MFEARRPAGANDVLALSFERSIRVSFNRRFLRPESSTKSKFPDHASPSGRSPAKPPRHDPVEFTLKVVVSLCQAHLRADPFPGVGAQNKFYKL